MTFSVRAKERSTWFSKEINFCEKGGERACRPWKGEIARFSSHFKLRSSERRSSVVPEWHFAPLSPSSWPSWSYPLPWPRREARGSARPTGGPAATVSRSTRRGPHVLCESVVCICTVQGAFTTLPLGSATTSPGSGTAPGGMPSSPGRPPETTAGKYAGATFE